MPTGDQSYHFNRNVYGSVDSRLMHFEDHKRNAQIACTINIGHDDPNKAAQQLGTALHPLQDWVAHGDYGMAMMPGVWITHNAMSPQHAFGSPADYPDISWLDAVGSPDGRAAGKAMHVINNAGVDYAIFTHGMRRWMLTKNLTDEALIEFRDYIRANGGCKCKQYFGVK
jgi:hypothetical protein